MNEQEKENFKIICKNFPNICINIPFFTYLLRNLDFAKEIDYDPMTERSYLVKGHYGTFNFGRALLWVSKEVALDCIKISFNKIEDNKTVSNLSIWSLDIKLEDFTIESFEKLLKLKAFW